jgi:hypothetical protein
MTATRFYFPASGAAAVSPAFSALWEHTAAGARHALVTTPSNTAMTILTASPTIAGVQDVLIRQYVSAPIGAQTISGTFSLVVPCKEGSNSQNMWLQVRISVVSNDGLTERGVLYAGQAQAGPSGTTTDPNFEWNNADYLTRYLSAIAVTPVVALANDRIVVELGARSASLTGPSTAQMRLGDPSASGDHALGQGNNSATLRSWIELSADVFALPPNDPTGLAVTDTDLDMLELSWTASTGSPTGYDVRIDGGAPIDVGNVLTHQFTGLDVDTSYTLEVRAYNVVGDSGWASIVGDTDPLPAPTGLVVLATTPDTIEVGWDAVGAATGYEVRIDAGPPVDVGTDLTYLFTGLTAGTYTIEVRAYVPSGSSTWTSIEASIAPPPPGYYRVDVVAGPYSWTIVHDDPADYGPMSGLWFGWEKPADDPFGFAHPDHMEAGIPIIVANPADLADLDEDDPVAIRVWLDETTTAPASCRWSFYGRVAEITAEPHPLGMIYNVDAVGYSVDPAEVLSGLEFWAGNGADSVQERADLILEPVGATLIGLENFEAGVPLDRDPAPSPAWTLLLDLFKGAFGARAFGGTLGEIPYLTLPVLHTYATDAGRGRGDGADFAVDYLDKYVHTDVAPLPGLFGELDSELYGLIMSTDAAYGSVDACGIETSSTKWQRSKADRPNRVRLEAWLYVTLGVPVEHVWTVNRPAAALIIEATYAVAMAYNDYDAQLIADFLLPDPASEVWSAESYRFRLSDFPDGLPPMIPNFADHDDPGSEERSAMWARAIVVNGIPSVHDPIGKGYVAGQLVGARLTISRGKVYVDFALNRTVPPPQPVAVGYEPAEPGYLSGEHLQVAPYDAVTWLDLDPELTGYDLRLARETV